MIISDGPGEHPDEHAMELNHEAPPEHGRLAFGDDEVRLPWLEADGDDEDEYRGHNTGQLVSLLILGLLALAVIGGGIWWLMRHRGDEVVVANGGVIAAPSEPYKEKPRNPGGKTFEGTGDTSFAVSEGQTRPARLGDADTAKPAADAGSNGGAAVAAADASGVGVQVAAYSSQAQAEAGWMRLAAQYPDLSGMRHRVVEGNADIGTVYRLQAVAADAGAAHALCTKLKAAGLACQVKN
jgi:hypothetical protein